MSERAGDWFLSCKGKKIHPFDLHPEDVDIEEIAHSLSRQCRFQGHTRSFYSVAQHSVLVSSNLPYDYRLIGLLHDATEAYCGDLIRPIKWNMPLYQRMEKDMWWAIATALNLSYEIPEIVKEIDNRALFTERRDLFPPGVYDREWNGQHGEFEPFQSTIIPLAPEQAEFVFLQRYNHLRLP